MTNQSKHIANSLLFAVIIALLLQPMTSINFSNQSTSELSEEVVISRTAQNEWTQSAGMASGGTGAIVWPSVMTVDSTGDAIVGGMVIGDATFGSHGSSSDIFGTGTPGQIAYIAKADGNSGAWSWLTAVSYTHLTLPTKA